jgi:hypothetical protein
MTAAEILRSAKELLIRDGWCQFRMMSPDGEHCMVGAVNRDGLSYRHIHQAHQCLKISIWGDCDNYLNLLTSWNDTLGRTVDEVLAKFDEAIALAVKA